MKNFDINQHDPLITPYHILITTKVIHPIVSHLPGLLLLVVVAVHIAVDHQLTCTKCGQTGWKYKKTFMSTTITTVYHVLIEEYSYQSDTS